VTLPLIIGLATIAALGVFVALVFAPGGAPAARRPTVGVRRGDQRHERPFAPGPSPALPGRSGGQGGASRRPVTAPGLSDRLVAAGLQLRPSEFRGLQLALALTLGALGALRFGQWIPAVLMAGIGWAGPILYLRLRHGRMRSVINAQLSPTLTTLANSLKAGQNLPQALDSVARNGAPPMSNEFARVVRELSMGATLEQALNNLIRRTSNEDLELAVTAILIQNTVGGNLANVLDNIEETIRTRVGIENELSTLTAQTRASAWVITLLPFGVAALLLFLAPTYFAPMLISPVGRWLLVACGVSIVAGNIFIRRAVRVEV
jgi:tight adherence protein B